MIISLLNAGCERFNGFSPGEVSCSLFLDIVILVELFFDFYTYL